MTKEEFLESYLKNLRNKLNELNFNGANREQAMEEASAIQLRMWNRLNEYFEEHFVDDLTDAEIEEYFQLVKKGTAEIISQLPTNINLNLN
jgi:dynactin complex subunit